MNEGLPQGANNGEAESAGYPPIWTLPLRANGEGWPMSDHARSSAASGLVPGSSQGSDDFVRELGRLAVAEGAGTAQLQLVQDLCLGPDLGVLVDALN